MQGPWARLLDTASKPLVVTAHDQPGGGLIRVPSSEAWTARSEVLKRGAPHYPESKRATMHHVHPRTTPTNTSDRSFCRFGDMCKSVRCPWYHPTASATVLSLRIPGDSWGLPIFPILLSGDHGDQMFIVFPSSVQVRDGVPLLPFCHFAILPLCHFAILPLCVPLASPVFCLMAAHLRHTYNEPPHFHAHNGKLYIHKKHLTDLGWVFRDHKCMIVLREFMSKVRSLLKGKKSIRRRRRLQKFLKARAAEGAEGSTNTPPDWADTRWSGWFDCSIWHAQNFVARHQRQQHAAACRSEPNFSHGGFFFS